MNIRKLACEAIEKILYKGDFFINTINDYYSKYDFTDEEKEEFFVLVKGVVNKKITLAYYLEPYLRKKRKPWVNVILLLSTFEYVYLDKEKNDIINDALEVVFSKDRTISNFIKGILLNLFRNPLQDIFGSGLDEIQRLSIKYSYPTWLVSYLLKDYPYDVVDKVLAYDSQNNDCYMTILGDENEIKEKEDILNELNISFSKLPILNNAYTIKGDIKELVDNGIVLDEGLEYQMMVSISDIQKGDIILDLNALDGVKEIHMNDILKDSGTIYACEIYKYRLKNIEKLLKKHGVKNTKLELVNPKNIHSYVSNKCFDKILVTLPSSGIGVLSEKVDLKYHISYSGVEKVIVLQRTILDNVWPLLKANGSLIILNKSINKSENEDMIREFIKSNGLVIEYEKTILPYEYNTNGFYICKLGRRK